MSAINVINVKRVHTNGTVVQMVIWQLDEPVSGSSHHFKYRLYCGRDGECFVRYDNERGKGDHRHVGDVESTYGFQGLERLLMDFREDIGRYL